MEVELATFNARHTMLRVPVDSDLKLSPESYSLKMHRRVAQQESRIVVRRRLWRRVWL
jgi:hypothetical protein